MSRAAGGPAGLLLLTVAVLLLVGAAFAVWVSNYQSTTTRTRSSRPQRPQSGQPRPVSGRAAVPEAPPVRTPGVPATLPVRSQVALPAAASPTQDVTPTRVDSSGRPADQDEGYALADPGLADVNLELEDEQHRARCREDLARLADDDPARLVDAIRTLLTDDTTGTPPKPTYPI